MAAFSSCKIVFEIGIAGADFGESADGFGCDWRATEICMNYNPSSVDDLLQPAGAKQLKRTTDVFDCRFKFLDLPAAPYLRQFPSDQIDN